VYNLGIKFWLKLDPSFSDICSSTMFTYDGWACSIEMDTFNGEVLFLMSNDELVILRLCRNLTLRECEDKIHIPKLGFGSTSGLLKL